MNKTYLPNVRTNNIIEQEIAGEVLIYDLDNDRALCLNETSALVWKACDGTKTVDDISGELSGKLNSKVTKDLVYLALEQLSKQNLLAASGEQSFEPISNTQSRRAAIKKIALASAVMLPVISSLVAPKAAHAASCVAKFASCASPGAFCCPGLTCSSTSIGGGTCMAPPCGSQLQSCAGLMDPPCCSGLSCTAVSTGGSMCLP